MPSLEHSSKHPEITARFTKFSTDQQRLQLKKSKFRGSTFLQLSSAALSATKQRWILLSEQKWTHIPDFERGITSGSLFCSARMTGRCGPCKVGGRPKLGNFPAVGRCPPARLLTPGKTSYQRPNKLIHSAFWTNQVWWMARCRSGNAGGGGGASKCFGLQCFSPWLSATEQKWI